jgi:tRNA pseudouridine55 synthase
VTIFSINVARVEGDEADFEVHCSGGTYVRSLCASAGDTLGTGGCLKALRRLSAGVFDVASAQTLETLEKGETLKLLGHGEALGHLPSICLRPDEMKALGHGLNLKRGPGETGLKDGACRLVTGDGLLAAIGTAKLADTGWDIHPDRVFSV